MEQKRVRCWDKSQSSGVTLVRSENQRKEAREVNIPGRETERHKRSTEAGV